MGTLRGAVGGTSRTGIAGSVQAVPRLNNAQDQPSVAAQELWRNTQYPNPSNGTPADLFANGENGVWYDPSDFSTMYQNSTGATPVTAIGQPVGLILDKSRWDGRGVVNLLTRTEEFNVGWSLGSTTVAINALEAPDGTLTADEITITNANGHWVYQSVGVIPNTQYIFSFYVRRGTATALRYSVFNDNAASNIVAPTSYYSQTSSFGWARISVPFTTPSGCTSVRVYPVRDSGSLGTVYLWGAQLELGSTATAYQANGAGVGGPGNHARQTGDAARPTVQARANILTRTEEFNQTNPWQYLVNAAVVANQETSPTGTLTADKLNETAGTASNSEHRIYTYLSGQGRLSPMTWSGYAKAAERTWCYINTSDDTAGDVSTFFNLANGTVGTVGAGCTASITSAGNGWYRMTVTRTPANVNVYWQIGTATANNTKSFLGVVDNGIYIWGAQLEFGPTANDYQRVTTATDYADIGLPRYLQFDGTDDFLVTAANLNMTATDEVTVCAGIFKGSNPTAGSQAQIILESSANLDSNNGTFSLNSFSSFVTPNLTLYVVSRGTVTQFTNTTNTLFLAPNTLVTSGIAAINRSILTHRVNGSVVQENIATQGTGTYGNYLLYIGRRGGTQFAFNGRIHQLIIRGAITGGKLLAQTERYVAEKTGITGL